MLSPLSEMRLLFCGDDGCHERLGVDHILGRSEISAKEIPDDTTGRSFFLRLPGDEIFYFWSSEKSKSRGSELLEKMNNLFQQRPSLSQLTGISDSRLDSFASYLMTNAVSSVNSMELKSDSLSDSSTPSSALSTHLSAFNHQPFSTMLKPHHPRQSFNQLGKQNPFYQGSLSPRSNAFKEGPSKTLRNSVREKLKRCVDDYSSSLVSDMTSATTDTFPDSSSTLSVGQGLKDQMEDMPNHCPIPLSLPMPSPLALPLSSLAPLSVCLSVPNIPVSSSSLFSPYYCLCPPSSSLQHVATPPNLPSLMPDSMVLPPLSSLLPKVGSSLYIPTATCDSNELPALDLPALLPPSSYMSISSSQQLLSFTPFVAEPIVHIPVIEVCSSGPGYLVSAGPAITSTIPLLPKLTGSLAPETESLAEKNARETLRMLMASTPSNPQLMKVLPVLTSVDENILNIHGKKQGLVSAGSRGLYVATGNVECITNSISCIGLMPSTKHSPLDENDDADGPQVVEDSEQTQSTQESENSKSKCPTP